MTTITDAIQAVINQASALSPAASAENLVYLAKSLQAISDSTSAATDAVNLIMNRATALSPSSSAEDLVYLAKAIEALAVGSGLTDIVNAGTTAVSNVNTAGTTQVSAVNSAGGTQVSAVGSAGGTQVGNVNTAGTTQVSAVNTAGTTQVGAVNSAGAAQLSTIAGTLDSATVIPFPSTGTLDLGTITTRTVILTNLTTTATITSLGTAPTGTVKLIITKASGVGKGILPGTNIVFPALTPLGAGGIFNLAGNAFIEVICLDGTIWKVLAGINATSNPIGSSPSMTGASSTTAGSGGLVPAPQIGDQVKALSGAGTYITVGDVTSAGVQTLTNKTITGLKGTKVVLSSGAMDLSVGDVFTYTMTAATTFSLANIPAAGTVGSGILELTNGAAFAATFTGWKWPGGTVPTLTAAGVDSIGFYTHDGGTTVRAFILGKDSK